MKDHIFIRITETQEDQEDLSKINYDTLIFERVHFYSAVSSPTRFDTKHFRIVKENPQVFQETLPGTLRAATSST